MSSRRSSVGPKGPCESSKRPRVFEADAATGELRRQGVLVKLNVQPFRVLVMLLGRPGEVITREQIGEELWTKGTFVDQEHGVNSAINRIREALGDSAKSPRYLETLARRGYRFVAPVERMGVGEKIAVEVGVVERAAEAPAAGGLLASEHELPTVSRRNAQVLFVLLQVMYLAFYVGAMANLAELQDIFSSLSDPVAAMTLLIVTAVLLIPVRMFLLTAVVFRPPGLRGRYLRLWSFLLPFDVLWSLAPFLLLHHISAGLALACVAPLVYSPFAQRGLVLMGAGEA